MKNFALITGASKGLGKSLAEELARRKHNLILASLPQQDLEKFSEELADRYKVKVKFYETDLTVKKNIIQFCDWINENFKIDILINNAGTGGSEKFSEVSTRYLNKMIQLNVMAPVILTHKLLDNLKSQKKAFILNISSLAALSPMGYKTVYPASKAFLQSFSRGLNQELKETSISVSVVNPAGMRTNQDTSQRIKKQGFFGKLTARDPDFVARYSIDHLFKKTEVIKVSFLGWLALKLTPLWLSNFILTRKMKNESQ